MKELIKRFVPPVHLLAASAVIVTGVIVLEEVYNKNINILKDEIKKLKEVN